MKKRLAILFASLSLCAVGFVGCGDDSKDIGDKCEAHEDCDAQENLFCQKQGDESKCALKIEKNAECINADDVCKTKNYSCQKDSADGNKLKCLKGAAAEGLDDGAKCAKADDKCKSAGFKCLAKGGDG